MGFKAYSGHPQVNEFKAQCDLHRRTGGRLKSLDDVRMDSGKGRANLWGGKGDRSRVSDPKEYRRRLGLAMVACPGCGRDVLRCQSGVSKCPRCGKRIQWGKRARKEGREKK